MMMRVSGVSWVLFMVVGTTLLFIAFINNSSSSLPDIVFLNHANSETTKIHNRKVLEKNYNPSKEKNKKKETDHHLNLDDYQLIDPVPSSKEAIKSGPIEHGTPLIPYIPKPPGSPIHPKHVTSPSPA